PLPLPPLYPLSLHDALPISTFMILGDVCTRSCGFCAVTTGRPHDIDPLEPFRLAKAVQQLGLDYVVITSVNRDDVESGGAEIFADRKSTRLNSSHGSISYAV